MIPRSFKTAGGKTILVVTKIKLIIKTDRQYMENI